MASVTCHTTDCPNTGQPIDMDLTVEIDGETYPIINVVCGGCGQPITDVTGTQ